MGSSQFPGKLTATPAASQVALLFLIIDKVPHEAVWTQWLKQLEDMVPATFLCDKEVLDCFEGLMPTDRNSVYDAQPYISLYVHPVPQSAGFPKGSIFYKREIAPAKRVQVRLLAPLISIHSLRSCSETWREHLGAQQGKPARAKRAGCRRTAHGHHSLAVAHRLLLIEALEDPLNQRFQLLCPATIPVRPARFTYEQLLAQKKSRVGDYSWWQVRPKA